MAYHGRLPEIRDRVAIRAILNADPRWSVYALGDLAPGYFEHSRWYSTGSPALILLYQAVTPPVLFALGDPGEIATLAGEIVEPSVYLHVLPAAAEALAARYRPVSLRPMLRMVLEPSRFRPEPGGDAVPLGKADAGRIERLYADGRESGESPDFFYPSMLENGVFFGACEGGELVAAAGTHLVAPEEGVGAIGNVYTRRDHRGRGHASRLTSAVAAELLRRNVRLVALNVSRANATAIRVYERLGFVRYCGYVEGRAKLHASLP
jgi:ribosomal protein S18 acetylase RimI-like enzyme